jgi:hypothetical protein
MIFILIIIIVPIIILFIFEGNFIKKFIIWLFETEEESEPNKDPLISFYDTIQETPRFILLLPFICIIILIYLIFKNN